MLSLLTNMPIEDLIYQLQQGGILMILGMGTVFVFLTVLIFTTKGISAICKKFAPETTTSAPKTASAPKAAANTSTNKDGEIAAAIVAAYSKSKQN